MMDITMLYWHWLAFGLVLMTIELLVPSFFFMWLGGAALCVGVIMLIVPDIAPNMQWILFAVLGIASFFISRKMVHKKHETTGPALNKRGSQMIGETVVIETAIQNGHGKAKVGDSIWSVEGVDMAAGTQAKIVSVNGTVLRVEKA